MKYSDIHVPFLEPDEIKEKVAHFRSNCPSANEIPVDVLEIAEFDLDLEIRPLGLIKRQYDIDALLTHDCSVIIVDKDDYMLDRSENRLRFSVAHEIGHLILHRHIYSEIVFESPEDWLRFHRETPQRAISAMDFQANEFAGRLLVPGSALVESFNQCVQNEEYKNLPESIREGDYAKSYIASSICKDFGVSDQVVIRRIEREGLWPPE